jgi:hypothetical protein
MLALQMGRYRSYPIDSREDMEVSLRWISKMLGATVVL